ncbi:MAG: hypothetical protein ABI298_05510 [Acidimicrobiales bacterium]
MRRRSPFLIGVLVALLLGLGSGAAYAFFSSFSSGSGVASVGTTKSVTVVAATGTADSKLFPSGSADLTLTLNNPNSYPVTIVSVAQNLSGSIAVHGGTGICSNTGVTVSLQTGLAISVASGNNVVVHIPNGASMSASSSSGCQGATFEIPVTITVQR